MYNAMLRLFFACLLLAWAASLAFFGPPPQLIHYVAIIVQLLVAIDLIAPIIRSWILDRAWPGEQLMRQRVRLASAISPAHRRHAANRLLRTYFDDGVDDGDVDHLDKLAEQGWRVTATDSVKALHLSRGDEHRIFIPAAWINGARSSNGEPCEEPPRASEVPGGDTACQPSPASPPSPSTLQPFREDDPWYSPEVLKLCAPRNTFTLFQRHGGVDLDWTRNDRQRTDPISREDCLVILKNMTAWIQRETSAAEAAALGTDLDYVRADLEHITKVLASELHQHCHSVMWEAFHDDNRERDEDDRRADEYCHRLYSGPDDE